MVVILPPIIFSSCFNMDIVAFNRNFGSILLYAIPGTILAAIITFLLTYGFSKLLYSDMSPIQCAAFSALISATDPVSVTALFQQISVDRTINILIVGESLLNDAVGIVL